MKSLLKTVHIELSYNASHFIQYHSIILQTVSFINSFKCSFSTLFSAGQMYIIKNIYMGELRVLSDSV